MQTKYLKKMNLETFVDEHQIISILIFSSISLLILWYLIKQGIKN